MRVIFLDIDGVLNTERSRSRCCGYTGIDDDKVKRLRQIVSETGAKIVLISTWKEDWVRDPARKEEQGKMGDYLDRKLKKQGLGVFDKTRSVIGGYPISRGKGILDYLVRREVEEYVILDDCGFDYKSCGLTERHVKTDAYKRGLTDELAKKAAAILKSGQAGNAYPYSQN